MVASIEDAHNYWLRRFIDGVQKRRAVIVLDNTNICYHHFAHYIQITEAFDYEVEIVTITVDPAAAAAGRTRHGVSLNALKSKKKALDDDVQPSAIPHRIRQLIVCAGSTTWQRWGRAWGGHEAAIQEG